MSFFDTHEPGCTPGKPCPRCKVHQRLRECKLGEGTISAISLWLTNYTLVPAPVDTTRKRPEYLDEPFMAGYPNATFSAQANIPERLKGVGIVTLADLIRKKEHEILTIKGVGRKTLNELKEMLAQDGLYFGMDPDTLTRSRA